jgi:Uma2 family endonuclease
MPSEPSSISIFTPVDHLPMRLRPHKPFSDDALFELCRINPGLRIERTREGEIVIMSPTGGETGRRNFTISVRFGIWVDRDGTGVGFDSSTGFILPDGAERSPDVAWLRRARWESLTRTQRARFIPLCPDFVIELRSPSDSLDDLEAKLREYIENGALLGWLIDPVQRRVKIYRPGMAAESLDDPSSISGDPVLPGLVLSLDGIW